MDAATSDSSPMPERSGDRSDRSSPLHRKSDLFDDCPLTVEFFEALLPQPVDLHEVQTVEELNQSFTELLRKLVEKVNEGSGAEDQPTYFLDDAVSRARKILVDLSMPPTAILGNLYFSTPEGSQRRIVTRLAIRLDPHFAPCVLVPELENWARGNCDAAEAPYATHFIRHLEPKLLAKLFKDVLKYQSQSSSFVFPGLELPEAPQKNELLVQALSAIKSPSALFRFLDRLHGRLLDRSRTEGEEWVSSPVIWQLQRLIEAVVQRQESDQTITARCAKSYCGLMYCYANSEELLRNAFEIARRVLKVQFEEFANELYRTKEQAPWLHTATWQVRGSRNLEINVELRNELTHENFDRVRNCVHYIAAFRTGVKCSGYDILKDSILADYHSDRPSRTLAALFSNIAEVAVGRGLYGELEMLHELWSNEDLSGAFDALHLLGEIQFHSITYDFENWRASANRDKVDQAQLLLNLGMDTIIEYTQDEGQLGKNARDALEAVLKFDLDGRLEAAFDNWAGRVGNLERARAFITMVTRSDSSRYGTEA